MKTLSRFISVLFIIILALLSCKTGGQDASTKVYEAVTTAADGSGENITVMIRFFTDVSEMEEKMLALKKELLFIKYVADDAETKVIEVKIKDVVNSFKHEYLLGFIDRLGTSVDLPKTCKLMYSQKGTSIAIASLDSSSIEVLIDDIKYTLRKKEETGQSYTIELSKKENKLKKLLLDVSNAKKLGDSDSISRIEKDIISKQEGIAAYKTFRSEINRDIEKIKETIQELQKIDLTNICKDQKSVKFISAINKLLEEVASSKIIQFEGNDVFSVNQVLTAAGLANRN